MKLLKYNKGKETWADKYANALDKIPKTVFYLYPFGIEGASLLLPSGIEIEVVYSGQPTNENYFCIDCWCSKFSFKNNGNVYEMEKNSKMEGNWPTRNEFELFCIENGIDSFSVPFLTQEEICGQMLSIIETMDIKDIADSLRI